MIDRPDTGPAGPDKESGNTDAGKASKKTAGKKAAGTSSTKAAGKKAAGKKAAGKAPAKSAGKKAAGKVSAKTAGKASKKSSGGRGPTDDEIRQRAYEIHQERGGGHGLDEDDWHRAERELRAGEKGKPGK